jgi:hypothetical protein
MKSEDIDDKTAYDLAFLYYHIYVFQRTTEEEILDVVEDEHGNSRFKMGSSFELKTGHLTTLWLIDLLIQKQGRCLQKELHPLYQHKLKKGKNALKSVLDVLQAVGYISVRRLGNTNLITLEIRGKNRLKEMNNRRKESILNFLELLQIDQQTYPEFAKNIHLISERAWKENIKKKEPASECGI